MCNVTNEEKKNGYADEREVWEQMKPESWYNSVQAEGSVFLETYNKQRKQIEQVAREGGHDLILEVGCGTGDIIGTLDTDIEHMGVDINPDFIEFCKEKHPHCKFEVQDATTLLSWWKTEGHDKRYSKPLVTCVNNTLNIMPEEIRGRVVAEMLAVAGPQGRCYATYWNGNFFSHAVMNYYSKNPTLCGKFDINKHVNWEKRSLTTPMNYSTEWHTPHEVQQLLRAYDVDVDDLRADFVCGKDHINTEAELAVSIWFSQASTTNAKEYYDNEDSQKFYNDIWGEETVHIGRHDLLSNDEKQLSKVEQIARAQKYHEDEFIKLIKSKFTDSKIRILDMGCGFGGLLRRLWESGMVWSATGCDISGKMCSQNRKLNAKVGCDKDITVLEESYLDVDMPDESVDLVISMDALLHVGPERQRKAVKEAGRILRPGGWMIFSDIMQQEVVDKNEMQPIYDRICLSKMGTVSNYKSGMEEVGFRKFDFVEFSNNVSTHYGIVREVLLEKGDEIGLTKEFQSKMETGLKTWRDLSPNNIVWGFCLAQKLEKF